ncbi:hypothetical protein [Clostridium rectalis]|uniref:hypothetical protein n=1 Tax=Clostridium rectalis TaxID=2040295 RepID=UPI000F6443B3|nr:hypothetical protein [Clostridium rectalis]
MLSNNLNRAMNDEINFQMFSENIYLAMQAYFSSIIKKLERIKDNSSGIFMLDSELSKRTFTPPINR